jgi:hypothetical protein
MAMATSDVMDVICQCAIHLLLSFLFRFDRKKNQVASSHKLMKAFTTALYSAWDYV